MSHAALRTILPVAGWNAERARAVEITGVADPILPTPFRIGETSAAALAAVGLAVSELWELRTGRRQEVAVDTRQATASLRSGHYMKLDGAPVSTERNVVMGVYPAKNGRWSYLHCNFPNHRATALSVLGVPEDREAVRKAVAEWDALALEEAIIAAKGAGGMVRTMDEWAKHPQAAAIASLPLMEIIKIGDSPAEKLPDGDRPLSRIRVLDLTRILAGPTCARTLAEHGADVLKITAKHLPNLGYQEYDTGHGKFSAHLDLRQPKDVRDLARTGPRGRRVLPGLPAGHARRSRVLARVTGAAAARHRVRLAVRLQPRRAVGVAARLRHGGANGQRYHQPPGRAVPRYLAGPAVLSGIGDRLPHRLSDGVRRDGGARAPRARGRQLACADLARSDRALARRTRPGAGGRAEGRAKGIHASGAGPLVDGERYSGRSAAPSRAGATPLRNAAALGATDRAARVPRAGVAAAGHVASRVSSDERDAHARRVVVDTRFADLPNGLFDNCKIAVRMLRICFIEPDADN